MAFDGSWKAIEEVVVEIIDRRGITPMKLGGEFAASGHRVISAKLVKNGRLDLDADEPRFVERAIYDKWMRSPLESGDVIMTSEAPLGELAYISAVAEWCLGQRLFALRPDTDVIDGRFLFYSLHTAEVRADIMGRASGTTVLGIRQAELRKVRVPVPSIDEQRAVASFLGALDDRIDLLRQTNTTLEAIAQALFKSWFVDFDPVRAKVEGREPEGMDAVTAALFPSEFEESEIGLIPKGWRVGVLRDLLELQRGFDLPSTQRTPGGYPIIAASGRAGSHFEPRVSGPGVVTGRSGVLGKVFLELEDFWPLNTTLWVRDFAESGPCFAYELLRRIGFGQFNAGSAVPTLNRNHVHGLPQVVPATAAIAAFETNALSIHRRVQANRECADLLSAVRDTLLPRLISGKLRIPEAEALVDEVSA